MSWAGQFTTSYLDLKFNQGTFLGIFIIITSICRHHPRTQTPIAGPIHPLGHVTGQGRGGGQVARSRRVLQTVPATRGPARPGGPEGVWEEKQYKTTFIECAVQYKSIVVKF